VDTEDTTTGYREAAKTHDRQVGVVWDDDDDSDADGVMLTRAENVSAASTHPGGLSADSGSRSASR